MSSVMLSHKSGMRRERNQEKHLKFLLLPWSYLKAKVTPLIFWLYLAVMGYSLNYGYFRMLHTSAHARHLTLAN